VVAYCRRKFRDGKRQCHSFLTPFIPPDTFYSPIGDLLCSHDGQWVPIEDILETGEYETVYNLRVADIILILLAGTVGVSPSGRTTSAGVLPEASIGRTLRPKKFPILQACARLPISGVWQMETPHLCKS
jgi:hypothetical protein